MKVGGLENDTGFVISSGCLDKVREESEDQMHLRKVIDLKVGVWNQIRQDLIQMLSEIDEASYQYRPYSNCKHQHQSQRLQQGNPISFLFLSEPLPSDPLLSNPVNHISPIQLC